MPFDLERRFAYPQQPDKSDFQFLVRMPSKPSDAVTKPKWGIEASRIGWVKFQIFSKRQFCYLNGEDIEALIRSLKNTLQMSYQMTDPEPPGDPENEVVEFERLVDVKAVEEHTLEFLSQHTDCSLAQISNGLREIGKEVLPGTLLLKALNNLLEQGKIARRGIGGRGKRCYKYSRVKPWEMEQKFI